MANLEKLKQYKKFIIDPVIVHFAPNAKGTTINPSDLNRKGSQMDDASKTEFAPTAMKFKRRGEDTLLMLLSGRLKN